MLYKSLYIQLMSYINYKYCIKFYLVQTTNVSTIFYVYYYISHV